MGEYADWGVCGSSVRRLRQSRDCRAEREGEAWMSKGLRTVGGCVPDPTKHLRAGREKHGNMPSGACGERKGPVRYGTPAPVAQARIASRGSAKRNYPGRRVCPPTVPPPRTRSNWEHK